ncbi:regulation of modification of synaptic structure [Sparganum proliferum]
MQTNISAEEFARFQSQLLEIRQQKYTADEARERAERGAKQLEASLAAKSCELAEVLSTLSRVQRAGDIDSVVRENQILRQKLVSIESSFQLQNATLRGECERLQADNAVLLSSLKLARQSFEGHPPAEDMCTQTEANFPILPTVITQTDPPSMHSASCQTKLSFGDYVHLEEALQASEVSLADLEMRLNEANRQLIEEKLQWGHQHDDLTDQLQERERQVQHLQEQCEDIANELATTQTRNERVQRDLRRQLARAIRCFKGSTFAVSGGGGGADSSSTSSLVLVNSPFMQQTQPQPVATWNRCAAETDLTSNNSFSICNTIGGGSSGVGDGGGSDEVSETSSNTSPQNAQTVAFSEEDFRCLLNRLSEVQEENCSLRRQIKRLSADLEAKSLIIQQRLGDRLASSTNQISALSAGHRSATTTTASASVKSSDLLSNAFVSVKSKLKLLEAVSLPGSQANSLSSRELRGLKQLCEELMTRNIVLEQALEETLRKSGP